jgi:DNA-binding transcriptional LysR family regulator
VRAVERGRRGARAALALETGELEIATVLSMAVGLLPRYIRRWRERYPDVGIRLHEFRHRSLLEDAVEQGIADFAIGPLPVRAWDGPR